ncbi:MAG: bifunctional [glutamine synthetase] adenylyltransferase/[glutamine synthetase]-adenylyl-L-tyrosine phosphorylase [Pseudomonadota bacterium]
MTKSLPSIKAQIPVSIRPADGMVAQERWENFQTKAIANGVEVDAFSEAQARFLAAIFQLSPHVYETACRHPHFALLCMTQEHRKTLETVLQPLNTPSADRAALEADLRIAKQKACLLIALADLSGHWTCDDVGEAMALVANATTQAAIRFLLLELHHRGKLHLPEPERPENKCGLTVIAMGKHGAGELNYSSDIDLVVIIDPHAPAVPDASEAITLFTRLIKQFIAIMQNRTGDGYVFRTDLRLRPDPGSMPLAVPLSLALHYYESRGQNWERAAFIKASPIAGDRALGEEFLAALQPFIWRRYLDYAAIADIHSIKRQIQSHRDLTALHVSGHNVKLGRGGIREIEFFVQTQQLIAGGRSPVLRGRKTLDMLQQLAHQGWIEQTVCDAMTAHYRYLRDVEHRLQLVSDAQTHTIPEDEEGLRTIAHLCGFSDAKSFDAATRLHLGGVETHYADLFTTADPLGDAAGNLSFTGDVRDPGTITALETMGFERPALVIDTIKSWHYGRYAAMQSLEAREQLTEFTPALLRALAGTREADEAFIRFDTFLKGLPVGFQLFSLLRNNPELLALLVRILGTAPAMAQTITRRPHIFDGLLEPGQLRRDYDVVAHRECLQQSLDLARDYEDGLERLRIYAAEQRFMIGTRILGGALAAVDAGAQFSNLAEAVLAGAIDWVRAAFEQDHGTVPGAEFGALALGNLGSRTLTASSDLDLILLYRFDDDRHTSDGRKPLHASQYYGRFAQRIIAALSAPTAQGIAYETDFRLRPAGQKGPIASSLRAFNRYYESEAWTWELLALARGRMVFGSDTFKARVESDIERLFQIERNSPSLANDVLNMRQTLLKEHPPTSEFDVKRVAGGLTDLDFLKQFQRLMGNKANWAELMEHELQIANMTLQEAHSTSLGVQQMVRLCLGQNRALEDWPDGFRREILKTLDLPDMKTAQAHLAEMQSVVHAHFLRSLKSVAKGAGT